jgi:hypothetical protein
MNAVTADDSNAHDLHPFPEKPKAMLLQALQYIGIGYHSTAVTRGHMLSSDRRLSSLRSLAFSSEGSLLDCGVVSIMPRDRSSWLMPIRRE